MPSVGGLARSPGGGLYLASDWEETLEPPKGESRRSPPTRPGESHEADKGMEQKKKNHTLGNPRMRKAQYGNDDSSWWR